ncbi:MAG TPA: Ig-like domain-containing protein [Chryseosolibacter sp.]|nr:Ig-like domain-containing protein [Chryseosolibacter sp.]
MKHAIRILAALAVVATVITFNACDDDDDDGGPTTFTLSSLASGDVDLNGATSAVDVSVSEPIVITFNTDVDAATATESNITLKRGFDDQMADVNITTSGNTVTITPAQDLSGGTQYILNIGALESTSGVAFTPIERSFTTGGTFVPDGQVAYYDFNENTDDQVGEFDSDVEIAITYEDGRNEAAGSAASFNGTTSIIEIPDGDELLSDEFTLSFWIDVDTASMKSDGTSTKGHFVMGIGAFNGLQFEVNDREDWFKFAGHQRTEDDTLSNDFFFNADGTTDAETGLDIATTVDEDFGRTGVRTAMNNWAHVVFVFSGADKVRSIYLNGELVMEQDYKLLAGSGDVGVEPFADVIGLAFTPSVAGPGQADYYDNKWNFGFWTSSTSTFPSWGAGCCQYAGTDNNHFKGLLDDVRFFHRAISEEEVELMYESEN